MKRGPGYCPSEEEVQSLYRVIELKSRLPVRDKVIFTLLFELGLRVGAVAHLKVRDAVARNGQVLDSIYIDWKTAKTRQSLELPVTETVKRAIEEFVATHPSMPYFAYSSRNGCQLTPQRLGSTVNYFLEKHRFVGWSSKSGRRHFATEALRTAGATGYTSADVQHLLGHAQLASTEAYVGLSPRLLELLRLADPHREAEQPPRRVGQAEFENFQHDQQQRRTYEPGPITVRPQAEARTFEGTEARRRIERCAARLAEHFATTRPTGAGPVPVTQSATAGREPQSTPRPDVARAGAGAGTAITAAGQRDHRLDRPGRGPGGSETGRAPRHSREISLWDPRPYSRTLGRQD